MGELRVAIDRVDEDLIALFAERMGYIHRATELKRGLGLPADIPERVVEVIANAARLAGERGLEPALYGDIWTMIVQAAIVEEKKRLGEEPD